MASQELRPYQEKMLDSIVAARLAGQNRVLVQAATGVGKTTVFSSLPTRLGPWLDSLPAKHRKMLVIAHREELIAQAVTRIRQNNPGLIVTKEKGNECANVYSDVIVASIQTLDARDQRRLHRLLVHMQFGLVIVDECFPAGTLVDGRPIESVRVGEMVTAFCPRTGVIEQKRVVRLMCKAPTGIVRVRASNGVTLHCTPNHRIWTMRGWVRAEDLRRSDTIAVTTEPPNENQDRNTRPVSPLPRPETVGHEGPNRHVQAQRPGLLFGRVQGQDNIRGVVGADGTDESEARIGADEAEQPDAAGLGTREDAGVTSQDRPQADVAWRQREADPVAAGRAGAGARLGDRSRGQDQGAEGGHLPDELQDRHRQQADADRDRSRRPESRGEITTGARLEKGRVSRWARVDDLEVLEPGSDGRFGGVCADGLVYNLEVEDFHTYAANGIFVSNCHHASADSYRRVLAVLGFLPDHGGVAPLDSLLSSTKRTEAIAARMNAWDAVAPQDRLLVGFTATPNRTDAVGLSVVFQTIAFSYPMKAAIKDAWLAPPRALAVATDASLEGVRTTAGEFNQKDLATAVNTPQRNAQALLAWQQHALGRPTLGFTVDVAHAHAAADLWQKTGHRFMPISGQTPDDDRRMLLRQYTEGQIDGLFNAMLLTEGTDLPRTSCILHLKPTKSATLYEQMCLDADTEILTETGWATIDTDITGTRVAAFDLRDGSVSWSDATRIERPRGREQMWGIDSPHLDIRVTGGHRMVVKTRSEDWHILPAEDLPAEVRVPVCGSMDLPDAEIADDDLTFLGFLLTDGSLSRVNGAVSLFQSDRYPDIVELIRITLESLGVKYTHSSHVRPSNFGARRRLNRWTVSRGKPRGRDNHLRGWGYLDRWVSTSAKSLTPAYDELSARQLGVLLRAMHAGDGTKIDPDTWTPRTMSICGNLTLTDQVQRLCVTRGFRCNIALRTPRLAMLHISTDRAEWSIVRHAVDGRPTWGIVDSTPDERVWCVTVSTGAIITRRNGKVAVVGNTGRGLRLFPGKDDCLILDMVDISRKHSLMAAPVLYGLPPLINAKGQRLDVLEADIAALRDEHAGVDLDAILSSLTDLDQLRSRLVSVNVFDVQPLDPSVLQATHLDWMRAGEVYRLNYPWSDGHETVRVSQDMLGHWDVAVEFHPRAADATALRQRTIASQVANLATAVMLGESYVTEQRGSVAKMKSRTARWKGNPASTKQMEFLKRLRVPFNAATLTSGAAGSLIDSALHHRRGRR